MEEGFGETSGSTLTSGLISRAELLSPPSLTRIREHTVQVWYAKQIHVIDFMLMGL